MPSDYKIIMIKMLLIKTKNVYNRTALTTFLSFLKEENS